MSKVVLALQNGDSLMAAKISADKEMNGAMRILIETILCMYDNLSTRTLQLMREVVEREKAEEKLRLVANVFNKTLDAICITDNDFKIIDANPTFYQLSGRTELEILGKTLESIEFGLKDDKLTTIIWELVHAQGYWNGIVSCRDKRGNYSLNGLPCLQ
ncbi:MAG: PAS domain S-box protein [Methylococcales bacterium]|nr:PAS domain S-box protein [Methylococcales bacterium]